MRRQYILGLLLTVIVLCAIGAATSPQLQNSGGSTTNVAQFGGNNVVTGTGAGGSGVPRVTISNDSSLAANQSVNVAQINGVAPTMGNGVSGTGVPRVTIASDSTGSITAQPGNTANTTPWFVKEVPTTGCGTTVVDSGAITLPTTSTAVTSFATTSCVLKIFLSNITASAVTINITDNQGTPQAYVTSFSLPANSNMILDMGGIKFSSGVKWSAGTGSAVVGQVIGVQ